MNRKNWIAICVILGFLCVIAIASYSYMVPSQKEERRQEISVVFYSSDTDRWTAFMQGAEQAGKDYDALIHFVTMTGTGESSEQQEAVNREMSIGRDGLVMAVMDSQAMSEYVIQMANVVPIVLVESKIDNDESLPCIGADAYAMGQQLANQVMERTNAFTIYVMQTENIRSCQRERLKGFVDVCEEAGREVSLMTDTDEIDVKLMSRRKEEQVLVALDDEELELAATVLMENQGNVKLYGIGSSENVVYALDQGIISGIVFQNGFNMGYEAVDTLLQRIRTGGADAAMEIDYHWVTRETLHDPENERLLYPIIQ